MSILNMRLLSMILTVAHIEPLGEQECVPQAPEVLVQAG